MARELTQSCAQLVSKWVWKVTPCVYVDQLNEFGDTREGGCARDDGIGWAECGNGCVQSKDWQLTQVSAFLYVEGIAEVSHQVSDSGRRLEQEFKHQPVDQELLEVGGTQARAGLECGLELRKG